ncbi:hypothetical protein M441DRAFT_65420 [Trichoderma asperellum CBS 433.97]|uniref:F-box domain-containing protein n=1 Tax=Trichoderma asperellum (strain ATCC 204424 / CBS 433.97 / NBRC 101777) TaxID=1042311 RepID=A0A2T3ZLV0_TRIA4|nr:hypothetical protein M441DRAFT_65420 [Trichoderma asperellum CBS 433.97]PTB45780.1 hypothetical protein M441DRAFT_65420 [Trichoderma asperellum CBS 433.97]
MATSAAGDEVVAAESKEQRLSFIDLPAEAQQEIISHCSQSDLICLAVVSRHFHELASAQLYKNFHIIFPDDDDLSFDSSIDGLASGLNTFTTSNYDYAKHLRDFSMDTLSAGLKGEASYQSYLYSASCGKFLNTLLHLTLKRARSLEVFRWNIRVELSRPVYRELHRIASLKKLHVRMQAGESYYTRPPPLPVSSGNYPQPSAANPWGSIPPLAPLSLLPPPPHPGATLPVVSGPPPALMPPSYKSALKNNVGKHADGAKEPSTFSGFKNLRRLSVLDIDTLDIVSELNICIKNSSCTLTELQLSLSDTLANQARKPSPGSDADDSDIEGEFQVHPTTQNNNNMDDIDYDTIGPVRAFRAQEERKLQESMLGRILELYPHSINARPKAEDDQASQDTDKKNTETPAMDPSEAFFTSIKEAYTKITDGSSRFSDRQEILDTMAKAARKYVYSIDTSGPATWPPNASNGEASTSTAQAVTEGESPSTGDKADAEAPSAKEAEENTTSTAEAKSDESSCSNVSKKKSGDVSPEDIDIEHLEVIDDGFEETEYSSPSNSIEYKPVDGSTSEAEPLQFDFSADSAAPTPVVDAVAVAVDTAGTSSKAAEAEVEAGAEAEMPSKMTEKARKLAAAKAAKINLENLMTKLGSFRDRSKAIGKRINDMRAQGSSMDQVLIKDADAQFTGFSSMVTDLQNEIQVVEEEMDEVERQVAAINRNGMRDYIRRTRGLTLTSLSIHLIPVKASVLSRSINISCLKQLTLLNVGNQVPIWNLLAKENRQRPLGLRSIFTDNVTDTFLGFASELEEIHELFLLERDVKSKPESFAPRGSTVIDQIRRLVLKKHIRKLKRLMIRDESSGPNWDCNEKTMVLICTQGRNLKELALSMNIHALHVFMQHVSGLVNLCAINIVHFRSHDACMSVMREILRFIVDNLSHHPELKLEWIAMEGDRVYQVVRPNQGIDDTSNEQSNNKRAKGKSKDTAAPVSTGLHNPFPALPMDSLDSESDSDDVDINVGTHLRFKTIGPLRFYDVWGVKIFEKEIQSGRL